MLLALLLTVICFTATVSRSITPMVSPLPGGSTNPASQLRDMVGRSKGKQTELLQGVEKLSNILDHTGLPGGESDSWSLAATGTL